MFIGLISYSLYLWHWPIFAFINYWGEVIGAVSMAGRIGAVVCALCLAILSWWFIEHPFRLHKLCYKKLMMIGVGLTGIIITLAMGIGLIFGKGFPGRFDDQIVAYADSRGGNKFHYFVKPEDIRNDRLPLIGRRDPDASISLLVWGDSHAIAAMPPFDAFLYENGLTGCQITHPATAPVLGGDWCFDQNWGLGKKSSEWSQEVYNYVISKRISKVVLVAYWQGYPSNESKAVFTSEFLSTIEKLNELRTQVFVVADVPGQAVNVPRFLALSGVLGRETNSRCVRRSIWDAQWGDLPASDTAIYNAGGLFINPRPHMLDSEPKFYVFERDGVCLYSDTHHLSVQGAISILMPLIQLEVAPLILGESSPVDSSR